MMTISCIDHCESTKVSLLTILDQIFDWAKMRNIILAAEHIRECNNIEANQESKLKNIDTKWKLDRKIF